MNKDIEVKWVSADSLKPHPKNPNKHPQEQIERLAGILRYQGFRSPVIVSNLSGFVTVGHGRIEAARLNGWDKVPVSYQDYEDEAQEYAHIVSDNAIADWAELNLGEINTEILDFGPDFDIDLLGIKDFTLDPADKYEDKDADATPEAPKVAKSKLGDLWTLGNHRLLCGDSTDKATVERLMNGEKADITFTSPPYNVGTFGFDGHKDKYGKSKDSCGADNKGSQSYLNFLVAFTDIALDVSNYVFFNNQFLSGNRQALAKFFGHYAEYLKEVFPWIKNTAPPNINKGVFTNRFEFFMCLEKDSKERKFPVTWQGKFHNIIEGHTAAKDNVASEIHSATMPSYVPEWFFERLSFIASVYDPFGGTGTTLIACEKTNRRCFMMELDPIYIDVILQRWSDFTGLDPVREDGATWSSLQEHDS